MKLTYIEQRSAQRHGDDGFTLVELLVVIVILGILATVVIFAIGGMRETSYENSCPAEGRTLITAAEAYFSMEGGTVLAAADATADGYENTLVGYDLIRSASEWYDLDANGELQLAAGSPCAV